MFPLTSSFREQSLIVSCAWAYGNEAEVGQGIKASGVPREELWITSKLFELHHHPEHVELAVKDTLKNLGLEYLDLYLMHWNVSLLCGLTIVTS